MRIQELFSRVWCWLVGHAGVYRQWEWSSTKPTWTERTDAWTCIRCDADIETPDPRLPRYAADRPYLTPDIIAMVNRAEDTYEGAQIRIRGGNAILNRPYTAPTSSSESHDGQDASL